MTTTPSYGLPQHKQMMHQAADSSANLRQPFYEKVAIFESKAPVPIPKVIGVAKTTVYPEHGGNRGGK